MTAFIDQKIDLASGPVHFVKGGSGPALLHLHSAAGPRLSPAIEKLAAKHTIYMPTMPGFNGTPTHAGIATMKDLGGLTAAFIRVTVGKSCDVVAESFGGWVALWLLFGMSARLRACEAGRSPFGLGDAPAEASLPASIEVAQAE